MIRQLNFSAAQYCNLSDNTAHRFAMDHALRIYRSNAIYTFIPKNACSTMRLSLAIENGCIEDASDHKWIHENNSTFRADLASLLTASYTFVLLRCPFARLASVYLDKLVGGEPAGIKFVNMTGGVVGIGDITFDRFVTEMLNPAIRRGNVHWRPQSEFLVYKQYDDYFCVEELRDAVLKISQKTDMRIHDARGYTGHGLDRLKLIEHGEFWNVSASEIRQLKIGGTCPDHRRLYNARLISIVKDVYADDIALYARYFGTKNLMFQ